MTDANLTQTHDSADQLDPYLGHTLGGFLVKELIGEGGMGRVYRSTQISLKRDIALKILSTSMVQQNTAFADRFIREATTAAQLAHPNIVQVIDAGQDKGVYYIAMELITGRSVDEIIRQESILPMDRAVDVITQAARGLSAAQKKQLVHRDIKPGNLMITEDGLVKVADFGLAKNTEATAMLTSAGQILGTPAFMSPEQGKGRPADHRSDQYSLGVTFFVLVTGTLPYKGESSVSIIYQHISDPVPDPCLRNPAVPKKLADIVVRMMSKDPSDRYENFTAVIDAIERATRKKYRDSTSEVEVLGAPDQPTIVFEDGAHDTAVMSPSGEESATAETIVEAPEAGSPRVVEKSVEPLYQDEEHQSEYWQVEGDLQARDIGFVLKEIARARQAGILTVSTETKATSLYVDGDEVRLYSVDGHNAIRLGDILLKHKHLSDDQLSEALLVQKSEKKLLGDILIDKGFVSQEERDGAIAMQIEEEFFELFALRDGHYKFIKQRLSSAEFDDRYRMESNVFSVVSIVRDARQKVSEWKRILHDLRDEKEIFVLRKEMHDRLEEIGDPLERRILEKLTGENNLADIVDQLLVPKFKVFKVVGKYLEMDRIYRPSLEDLKNGADYMRSENRFNVAVKLLERAFNLDPSDTKIVESLASSYEELLDAKRAAAYYKILAKQYFDEGREADGLTLCDKIVKLYPADSFAFERLFRHNRSKGNLSIAIEMGRGLLRTYVSEGRHADAKATAEFILEKEPEDLGTIRRLVNIHLEEGRIPEAIEGYETLERIVEASETLAPSQKRSELTQIWEKVLRLDPSRGDMRKKLEATVVKEVKVKKGIPRSAKFFALVIGVILLVVAVGAYYELSARSYFKKVEEKARDLTRQGKYGEADMEYGTVITDYSFSTMADLARERREELRSKIDSRNKAMARERKRVEGEITQANQLIKEEKLEDARKIFQAILQRGISRELRAEAERGAKRIEDIVSGRVQKRFAQYVSDAQILQEQGRREGKTGELASLEKALKTFAQALKALEPIQGKYSKNFMLTKTSISESLSEDITDAEIQVQGIYFAKAKEMWVSQDEGVTDVLELLEKSLAFKGDEAVRKEAVILRTEVIKYKEAAQKVYKDAWDRYKEVEDRLPEERLQALQGIIAGAQTVLQDYPLSELAKSVRFPVLVVTSPPGAIMSGDKVIATGPSPGLVLYPPYGIVACRVVRRGYLPTSFHTDGKEVIVRLNLVKTKLYSVGTAGAVQDNPVVRDGRVYYGDRAGQVAAFDGDSPKGGPPAPVWTPFEVDDLGGVKASPTLSEKRLYFSTATLGQVYAVKTDTGEMVWERPFRANRMVDHTPLVVNPLALVVVADVAGRVYGIGMETGLEEWAFDLPGDAKVNTQPVLSEKENAAFFPLAKGVAKVDLTKGTLLWVKPIHTIEKIHLALSDNVLVVSTGENIMAFDAGLSTMPGAPRWVQDGHSKLSPPAVFEGKVFVGDESGVLAAFSLQDGNSAGRFKGEKPLSFASKPCMANNRAYLVSDGRVLVALDTTAETFLLLWTYDFNSRSTCSPALLNSRLFIGTTDAGIVVVETD